MAVIQRHGVDGKVCSTCQTWKPLTDYYPDQSKRESQGFRHCRCKACHSAAYYAKKRQTSN